MNNSELNFETVFDIYTKYSKELIKARKTDVEQEINETLDDLLENIIDDVGLLCADQYIKNIQKKENPQEVFKQNILKAASEHNLFFLEILITSTFFYGKTFNPNEKETTLILHKLIEPYHLHKNQGEEYKAGYLFETFIEYSCSIPEAEVYNLMNTMLNFTKVTNEWYEGFMSAFFRLRDLLPRNNQFSFALIKKAYDTLPSSLALDFRDFIKVHYIDKGLVNKDYEWIG